MHYYAFGKIALRHSALGIKALRQGLRCRVKFAVGEKRKQIIVYLPVYVQCIITPSAKLHYATPLLASKL
jgi:hypothetical protein